MNLSKVMEDTFEVTVEPSGQEIEMKEGQTLLDGLIRNGINVQYGCRHGSCSLCKAQVHDGDYEIMDRVSDYSLLSFERDEGYVLLCSTIPESDLTVEIEEDEDERIQFLPVHDFEAEVVENVQLTHDIHKIKVKLKDPSSIEYLAGQYVEFDIPELDETRAYSMATKFDDSGEMEFHIKRVPNGVGSNYLCDIEEGESLTGSGPYGKMQLVDRQKDIVFVAGGSGMAPIKSLVEELLSENYQHEAWFFYGARTTKDLYYMEYWQNLDDKYKNFHFIPALSDQEDLSKWDGETGYIADVVGKHMDKNLEHMDAYLCGPPILIETSTNALYKRGLKMSNIFYDEF